MLRLRTLGGLSVDGAGRVLSGSATQPRRLAVLALIGCAGERGITRDRLIGLLWTDTPEESARKALAQALHALRRDLGADELFLGVQDLRLNREVATCDLLEYEAALAEQALDRAASLYGGPFLEGFRLPGAPEFERWADEERTRLAHRHRELLERLARQTADGGDALGAAGWWRKLAALDPLNARIAIELMRSLAAAGERHAALQHARIYEALVEQELGIDPDREVLQVADSIRRAPPVSPQEPDAVVEPPASVPAAESAPASTTDPTPAPAEPVQAAPIVEPRIVASQVHSRRAPRWVLAAAAAASVLVLLALAWRGARAPADPRPLLAVGGIIDYRTDAGQAADPVSDMLATNLARVSGLHVLSSARMLELLEERAPGGDVRAAWARAARRAGASELIEGGVHRLGADRLLLELRRVDVRSGSVRTAYRLEGADAFELVGLATAEIAVSLGLVAAPLNPADVSTHSLVAYRFYEEGLRAFARGNFRGAEGLLDAALREDSTFAIAAYYRWLARSARGQPMTLADFERLRALSARASERERLMIQSWLALAFEEPTLPALADSLASRYPAEVDGHFLRGFAHMANADLARALPDLQRAFALDSLSLGAATGRCRACDALQEMISAYHGLDSLAAAERVARDWVRRDPRSARALAALAGVLFAQGRHEEAIEARRTATAFGPYDLYDAVFPAAVRLRAGEFQAADATARSLMRNAPDDEVGWQARWLLLISLRHQARWAEALQLVREVTGQVDGSARGHARPALLTEALISLERGEPARAALLWDSLAASHGPEEIDASQYRARSLEYTMSAIAYAAAGDTLRLANAADSVAAMAARSANRRAHYLAEHANGLVALARADTAGAIEHFTRAIWSPTVGFTQSNLALARLLLARGRSSEAIATLESALRGNLDGTNLYTTHTELHELLGEAYLAQGEREGAAVHFGWVARALANADPQARPRLERALEIAGADGG